LQRVHPFDAEPLRKIERPKEGFAGQEPLHRIRQAMSGESKLVTTMRGVIVADETYIGGAPKNRHASDPRWRQQGLTDKTPVLSLVNASTGEVRSTILPWVDTLVVTKFIGAQVDVAGSHLFTDSGKWYMHVGQQFISHESVNHSIGEYVRKGASTNMAEGYFSQLKRSIDGTHHHVSEKHLDRYVGEFDFRYSTCKMSDGGRMRTLAHRMEGRLSYNRLAHSS
jgi:hypothetical protein